MSRFTSKLVSILIVFFIFVAGGPIALAQKTNSAGKPWLGVAIEKGSAGVLVKGIIPKAPAEMAGFKVGDEILKIDGKVVKDPQELISVVQSMGIGQSVNVDLLRDKKTIKKSLKLVVRPDELKLLQDRLVGKAAPNFELEVVHGKEPGRLKDLQGRVVVFEIWATWCPACRATHARLSEFASANPSIAVLAASDEDTDALKAYASKLQPKFTIVRDPTGKSLSEWLAAAIPMISVIDKSGRVAAVTVGAGESIEEAIRVALALNNASEKKKP